MGSAGAYHGGREPWTVAWTIIEFDTPRLALRRWRRRDRAPFAAMGADPDVMRYFAALDDVRA